MVVSPPVCEGDGSYRPEQGAGGLMWCVTPSGRPLHHTVTRGLVRCRVDGEDCGIHTITKQIRIGQGDRYTFGLT